MLQKNSEPWGFAFRLKPFSLTQVCSHGEPRRSQHLQRLFSTFPGGWPGVGLLLLRAAVGITAVIQGGVYLTNGGSPTLETWVAGLFVATAGISLLIGFLTPLSGALVALATLCIARSWFPLPAPNLFSTPLPAVLVIVVSTAVALLGPGALSVDCRLFGRREIIIPHTPRSPKS